MDDARQVLLSETILDSPSDSEDVEATVQQHARFVYRLAFAVLRNHHDAEDATQETFVRVWRHRRDLAGVRDRKLWLARIVWRVALDRLRKHSAASLDESTERGLEVPSGDPGAEHDLIRAQRLAFLERAITALPTELRDVVTLTTVDELSGAEIAALLNIPEASVRTRMFRARRLLKEKLITLMEGQHES